VDRVNLDGAAGKSNITTESPKNPRHPNRVVATRLKREQGNGGNVKASFGAWTAFLLFGFQTAAGQVTPWLTDEQARDVATAVIHSVYPEPCYSTYRNERIEDFVVSLRRNPVVNNHLNNSVYFYRVASDACDYVVEKEGKPFLMTQVVNDCCDYGIVAVDRGMAKSYWFTGQKKEDIFKEFARDEQIHPDSPEPT
jgi:hypothetical protein